MFSPIRSPASSAGAPVFLRLSLNTPVVAVEELPVGPARAGIALHRDAGGRAVLRVAVRAVRSGRLVLYAPDAGVGADLDDALEMALSYSEGMGFLFDDDEVAAHGAEPAAELWRHLVDTGDEGPLPEILLNQRAADVPRHASALPLSKFRRLAAGERPGAPMQPLRRVSEEAVSGGQLSASAETDGVRLLSRF